MRWSLPLCLLIASDGRRRPAGRLRPRRQADPARSAATPATGRSSRRRSCGSTPAALIRKGGDERAGRRRRARRPRACSSSASPTRTSDTRMPPERGRAAHRAEQIATLKAWIDAGGDVPRRRAAGSRPARPLGVPRPGPARRSPPVETGLGPQPDRRLPRRRVDEARASRRSRRADKRLLLRRVYLDLIGLPPTPRASCDAFLADTSPDAYEKVVDRLLASPAVRRALGPALDGRLALQRLVRPRRRGPQQPAAHLALARLDRRVAQRRQGLRPDGPRDARRRRAVPRPTRARCGRPASSPGSTSSSTATPGWTRRSSTRPRRSSA